jgi:hypothetical protein
MRICSGDGGPSIEGCKETGGGVGSCENVGEGRDSFEGLLLCWEDEDVARLSRPNILLNDYELAVIVNNM